MAGERGRQRLGGTREWAVAEINCSIGCPHGCRYCYARYDQVERRKLVSAKEWQAPLDLASSGDQTRYPGRVMFPSHHDIVRDNLDAAVRMLYNLLAAGNKILVVSKPHLEVIERLVGEFSAHKTDILFRFTITARNSQILRFWEPAAPLYPERRQCLILAFEQGFATSVSIEPMLDVPDVVTMARELLPHVTDTVWLGKMNKIDSRVSIDSEQMRREINRIVAEQSDARIMEVYRQLAETEKIRWKESIKEVIGMGYADEPGLDI